MEGLTKGRWLFFLLAFHMNCIQSAFAYKKPPFCQKEGEPFSFLWRVSNRDPPAFLFGTVHVPYPRVWPHVPPVAKEAFSASTRLLLELDLVRPATARLLARCQMLPPGRRLDWVRARMPQWTSSSVSSLEEVDEEEEWTEKKMLVSSTVSSTFSYNRELTEKGVEAEMSDKMIKKNGEGVNEWVRENEEEDNVKKGTGNTEKRSREKKKEEHKGKFSTEKKAERNEERETEGVNEEEVEKKKDNREEKDNEEEVERKKKMRERKKNEEWETQEVNEEEEEVEKKKGNREKKENEEEEEKRKKSKIRERRKKNEEEGEEVFRALAGEWRRKRPVWILLLLDSLTEGEVRGRGAPVLDLFLAQEAEREGKGTEAVEEVEEQCRPLNSLNDSQVLFALNHTLTQHELSESSPHPPSSSTDELIRHYNCGDLDSAVFGRDSTGAGPVLTPPLRLSVNASSSLLQDEQRDEDEVARGVDEYLRRELVRNRNQRMGSRVVEIMRKYTDESLFFAFGAGHFLGNNSVLDFIQDHGFEIEHLSVYAKIPKSKPKKSVQSDGLNKVQRPESETIFSRKGQGRRSSRHRSPIIPSLGIRQRLFDTSTPTPATTQRAKSFNDLWVRLGDHEKKSKIEIHSIGEHHGPHQAFQKWYQESHRPNNIPYSAGAALLSPTQLLFIVTIICSYFSAFHIDVSAIVVTGIT